MTQQKLSTLKSSWTPLTNDKANEKFDLFSHNQKFEIVTNMINKCKSKQIDTIACVVDKKRNHFHADFTRFLPKKLSLKIFEYLDPRSLCRASQVCGYWNFLCNSDELWLPKCERLNWKFSNEKQMHMQSYKDLYISNIIKLNVRHAKANFTNIAKDCNKYKNDNNKVILFKEKRKQKLKLKMENKLKKYGGIIPKVPWKNADYQPKEIIRNNYLDNEDIVKNVQEYRRFNTYGEANNLINTAKCKISTRRCKVPV
ncbi:F-box only protein 16 [Intoshia linei]|uniref:F-box only protein 16 n=1 Tax=Intoshia linei TaxID=1819745 RepID=A0A177AXG0_9BILA|nr:F-box only protein 16 [Intoshia linei]